MPKSLNKVKIKYILVSPSGEGEVFTMAVTNIGSNFISETTLFLRNVLRDNITDPLGRNGSVFMLTSYPRIGTTYPVITISDDGIDMIQRGGLQSEGAFYNVPMEIRVWGRTHKERDNLSQDVLNFLQRNQFGAGSTNHNVDIHGFSFNSSVNIDEEGEEGIKSKVMQFGWSFFNQA
jgi:hypothetical protein|tara:strand:+ start:425 stop:955 length:531 start_codon:yes stop_codon:yes gene_type:complete